MRGRPCGNKKIQGRKRFIVTDVLGLLLALSITEANRTGGPVGERAGALVVLAKLGNRFSRLKTIRGMPPPNEKPAYLRRFGPPTAGGHELFELEQCRGFRR